MSKPEHCSLMRQVKQQHAYLNDLYRAGISLLTALKFLVRKEDSIELIAFQSEHRQDVTGNVQCHVITEEELAPYEQCLQEWGGKFVSRLVTLPRGQSLADGILKRAIAEEAS
jgi:hypothetical protein